ncbi:MAG: MarR family transcriptional regulator [Deltaproteobacteria bacterium]|nr:MAG: MarR family transcriptional regulator [Deltaproteobacteria bacterium]RUA01163.1 MAG: MarR family transcriptional regulator [Deltaproteobacteria bacterium]
MDKKLFFQNLIHFIGTVHASTHFLMKNARSDEITPQQHSILEYIFFNKAVTTSQVADCLNISLPNASRELKKLLNLELIVKVVNNKDRRTNTIRLSVQGQNLMHRTFERIEKNFWERSGEMSEKEMKAIISSIKILEKKIFIP